MDMSACHKIGYYVTKTKNAKMNWAEFGNICRKNGFTLVKLDLLRNLEEQGPFFAIVHKMTEIILNSSVGDEEATVSLHNVESYINAHPEVIVIDPLDTVRTLLDRSCYYRVVQSSDLAQDKVFTPTFVDLKSSDLNENLLRLKEAGVTFPFVCKPSISHGPEAHQMAIVFNEQGVVDCKPPCVAQSFINHNATLFKIFIVNDKFIISERPSLKNFSACGNGTIFFTTADVSKLDSTSSLTVLDPEDAATAQSTKPSAKRVQHIVDTLRQEFKMLLIGVDFVIERDSGSYGIIDINVFPGYDKFPNFFESLMKCILDAGLSRSSQIYKQPKMLPEVYKMHDITKSVCTERRQVKQDEILSAQSSSRRQCSNERAHQEYDQDDSGFDTGDSSDERKKKWRMGRGRSSPGKKLTSLKGALPRQNVCQKLSCKIASSEVLS